VECCAEIRSYRGMAEHELPVILVTATEYEATVAEGFAAGATDYLAKPFSLGVLLARLESALRLRQLVDTSVQRERDRSLLRRMLPESIIERLEGGQSLIADHHDEVTVLFSDIVGFTELSQAWGLLKTSTRPTAWSHGASPRGRVCMSIHPEGKVIYHAPISARVHVLNGRLARVVARDTFMVCRPVS